MKQRSSFAQLVGTSIKQYGLIQLLQQEQHEAVFLARHIGAEQICQLRLFALSEEVTAQERLILLERVQQEMSHIAALQHPVIQPILEYGHDQGMAYLVTPFIPMRYALMNVLDARGPMDVIRAGYNLELLASALEYAHKHAVIHGNLAASSVFLRPSSGSHPPTLLLTGVGIVHVQTLLMPPNETSQRAEYFTEQPIDVATDVFALGALLYQMLTAHEAIPTRGRRPGKQMVIPPLKTWRQDLPTQLDAVINTACRSSTGPVEPDPEETQVLVPLAPIVQPSYQSPNDLVDAYYQAVMPGTRPASIGRVGEETVLDIREVRDPVTLLPTSPSSSSSQKGRAAVGNRSTSVGGGQVEGTERAQSGQAQESASPVSTSPIAPVLVRRKLTAALMAAGVSILLAGGGWLFLQLQQRLQVAQSSTSTPTPEQQGRGPLTTPPQQSTGNGTVIAHTADLPVNHASTFTIPNSQNANLGVLIHLPDNRFVAFDSTCTHRGCQVSYSSITHLLKCPCHGSVFDPAQNATVLVGPAQTALTPVGIHINADGTITVK